MSGTPIDGMVRQVMNLLASRGDTSTKDVYARSDGTVTGPRDNTDERVADLRVVGVFTPSEHPTEAQVRETLARGMREAAGAARDEERAVASGERPKELPGTPPRVSG